MPSATSILARRRGGDVLIADEPCRVLCAWPDLRSADGHDVAIEWQAAVACVDSPADRALLAEQLMADAATVTTGRVASLLVEAAATALGRLVATRDVETLCGGGVDAAIGAAVEADARRAAFAAGLTVVGSFALRVTSPSRERERTVSEVRAKLDALRGENAGRADSIAILADRLIARGDARHTARAIADLRLSDPHDLLVAASLADPAWHERSSRLWVVAGTKLASVDPLADTGDVMTIVELDSLGPLRSCRAATIDGAALLLIGARDGVHAVDRESGRVVRTFRDPTGSAFGFNAACFLTESRRLVATHSARGVVMWDWDDADAGPTVVPATSARSVTAIDGATAVLVTDGRAATFGTHDGLTVTATSAAEVGAGIDGTVLSWTEAGRVSVLRTDELARGEAALCTTAHAPIVAAAAVDLCGVPRAVVAFAGGGLALLDFAGADALPIGPPHAFARALRARPGVVAAVNADRSRVFHIHLGRPSRVAGEWHVAATLGNRAADLCFA